MLKHQATKALFSALESAELQYAVLRNYDQYPDFGHDIDMVLSQEDLPAFRALIIKLAAQERWYQLTECHHWATSANPHHRIQIFRCYLTKYEYLQIDLFHSFLLWGLPLFNEEALLAKRIKDERGFTRINTHQENIFRMLQIHRLNGNGEQAKIQRYRQRILDHASKHGADFTKALVHSFGQKGLDALESIQIDNNKAFLKQISHIKKTFFLRQLTQNPAKIAYQLWNRLVDWIQFNHISPCGQVIKLHQSTQGDSIFQALDSLKNSFAINRWAIQSKISSKEKWRTLERGGLVILFQNFPEVEIPRAKSTEEWLETLINQIEKRHHCHYSSSGECP